MKKYLIYGVIGLLASLLAIIFILQNINVQEFSSAWASMRYGYALLCLALLFVGLFTRGVRWRILLSNGLSLRRSFNIMNVAYLINGFVPFRLGEAVRAYLATHAEPPIPLFTTAATIVVERLLDLLSVVVLIALALLFGPVPPQFRSAGILAGAAAITGFLILVFFASQRDLAHTITRRIVQFVPILGRLRIDAWLDHFLDGLLPLTRWNTLLLALVWTAISWALSLIAGYVGMLIFYDQASWVAASLLIAAAALSIAVPAVPGSLGTFEAGIIFALGAAGYTDIDTAAAFAVTIHMINIFAYAVCGGIGIVQEGVTFDTFRSASAG